MAGEKRERGGGRGGGGGGNTDRQAKRRKYAAAAGKSKAKSNTGEIRGPGLWLSCVRRKEAISTSEAYDLLNDVADRLYPETSRSAIEASNKQDNDDKEEPVEDDIEAQIAKELEELQPQADPITGKKKMRFQGARTETECLVWISCAPPIDPIKITYAIVEDLKNGGPIRTRFLQRITPVTNTAHADENSLKSLAYRILQPLIAPTDYNLEKSMADKPIKYRIEPMIRNHSGKLNRQVVTDVIGEVVRDLANPNFQLSKRATVSAVPAQETTGSTDPETAPQEEASGSKDQQPSEVPQQEPVVPEETGATVQASEEQAAADEPANGTEGSPTETTEPVEEETPWFILPAHRRHIYVDLKHPTHTILVSALRGVCGISVVEGYEEGRKFNVQQLGDAQNKAKLAASEAEKGETLDKTASAEAATEAVNGQPALETTSDHPAAGEPALAAEEAQAPDVETETMQDLSETQPSEQTEPSNEVTLAS